MPGVRLTGSAPTCIWVRSSEMRAWKPRSWPCGSLVPLSTVAHVVTKTVPESINHFQQLNSATIQGVTMPGVAQGTALQYLQDLAARTLPEPIVLSDDR